MKKKVWWKKAALLCGMMALLPFCMGPFPNRKFLSRIPSFQSVFGNCPIRKNKPRLSQWNKRTKKALRECTEGLFNCKL